LFAFYCAKIQQNITFDRLLIIADKHVRAALPSTAVIRASHNAVTAYDAHFDILVVYHLHGEAGWSMVCANGNQNF